jgi:hypothetical protein
MTATVTKLSGPAQKTAVPGGSASLNKAIEKLVLREPLNVCENVDWEKVRDSFSPMLCKEVGRKPKVVRKEKSK